MANENHCNSCQCRVPITLRDFFWQDPFFSSNWDNFNDLHNQMLQEAKNIWQKFDNRLKRLECKEEKDSSKSDECKFLEFPSELMKLPSIFNEEAKMDLISMEDNTIKIKDDEKAFEVSLDTHNYRPDEIKVNVENNVLTVEGKHEEKSDDGNRYVTRQFIRKYLLPEECSTEKVDSNLSADGVLLVTAHKKSKDVEISNRNVPITMMKD